MITLNPYLVFKGNCEEAFLFYKTVFGGEILFMGRYKDVPPANRPLFPGAADEQIMHATLQINAETILMGNDGVEAYKNSTGPDATAFFLYISTGNQADAYRIFDELSAGGEIIMPISGTFWSHHFGIVVDKFDIHWKITFDPDKK